MNRRSPQPSAGKPDPGSDEGRYRMKIFKFYDTCSLLLKVDNLWEDNVVVVLSSITLEELENIKTSNSKDSTIKYKACDVAGNCSSFTDTKTVKIVDIK